MNLKARMPEAIALSDKVSTAQDKIVTELNMVSSGIDDIMNLDEFSGAAADSAKEYFENVHKTIVLAFQQLMIEIDTNLENHINTFHSDIDTSTKAKVDKHYLEEVKEDIETPFESLVETNEKVISTIDDVEDIVSVTKPKISSPQSDKNSIVELTEELIASLETYTTISNDRVKEMIYHVKALMKDIQSYKGEERFKNVNKGELIDPIRKIMMEEGGVFETLFEKVANNETLSPKEEALLYNLFQNIILTDEIKEEINNVKDSISEENIDQLKDRLNEIVVHSQEALDKEIGIIQAYLYLGDMRPKESDVSTEDREKLTAYLMLLKNYDQALNRTIDPAINVGTLEYEKNRNDIPGHYFYSELEYAIIPKSPNETKEEYRNRVFHPDKFDKVYIVADVQYYPGTDGVSEHLSTLAKELKKKKITYTRDFVAGKITDKVMSTVAELGEFPLLHELASDYVEYSDGERELTNDITVIEGMEAAGRLNMEFGLTETKDRRGKGAEISDIQMIPTQATFQMIDRWREAREVYPEIPFPDDALETENWYEVSETFQDMKLKYGKNMSDYIRNGGLDDGETIEDIEIVKD